MNKIQNFGPMKEKKMEEKEEERRKDIKRGKMHKI